jgi:hypothetical protein
MTPFDKRPTRSLNLGSLRLHLSFIDFADLRQEGSILMRSRYKWFWQENAFDSTRDQKEVLFQNT